VVSQDLDECVLVLGKQECVEHTGGKSGECLVRGREDREGSFAIERLDQAGCVDRSDEGAEVRVTGCNFDDGADSGDLGGG
jgi:hypothetical protein